MSAISSLGSFSSVGVRQGATLSTRNTASANRTNVGTQQSGGYISTSRSGNSSGTYRNPAGSTLQSASAARRTTTGSTLSSGGAGGVLTSNSSRSTSGTYTSTTRVVTGSTGGRCIPCGG